MIRPSPKYLWTVAGLLVALVIAAWGASQAIFRSDAILAARHPLPPSAIVAATTPEAIARGERLVVVTNCTGCHGVDLTGGPLRVAGTPVFTANLTRVTARRTDAELDRAIRHGLRPNGSSELAMPSTAYSAFTDDEMASIIGYLRSLPPKGVNLPKFEPGLFLRASLLTGGLKMEADQVASAKPPLDAGPGVAAGRHLAAIACGRCHGSDLGGTRDAGPDMTVRGYYSRAQFFSLVKQGEMIGEGNMQLMTQTAKASFSHFTDGEIEAIYAYLDARDRILIAQAAKVAQARKP